VLEYAATVLSATFSPSILLTGIPSVFLHRKITALQTTENGSAEVRKVSVFVLKGCFVHAAPSGQKQGIKGFNTFFRQSLTQK
jgi:hypothetical protein